MLGRCPLVRYACRNRRHGCGESVWACELLPAWGAAPSTSGSRGSTPQTGGAGRATQRAMRLDRLAAVVEPYPVLGVRAGLARAAFGQCGFVGGNLPHCSASTGLSTGELGKDGRTRGGHLGASFESSAARQVRWLRRRSWLGGPPVRCFSGTCLPCYGAPLPLRATNSRNPLA